MKNRHLLKYLFFLGIICCLSVTLSATNKNTTDSLHLPKPFLHRIETEIRPSYIFPTHPFLRKENEFNKPIRYSFSSHLKYSFQFHPDTYAARIYGSPYQGIGLAYYDFSTHKSIGTPLAFYLFQGARIASLISWLSFNYEWNFGLSFGWKPYHYETNTYNRVIGSKINAYINTNFYLNWILSPRFNLTTGISLTHFSNGNTHYPNAGLNTAGINIGLIHYFNHKYSSSTPTLLQPTFPAFHPYFSYDLILFGSWRRKGVRWENTQIASPNIYTVWGFNFSPMYNINYKFRTGLSIDGTYDGSANVFITDYIDGYLQEFFKPPFYKQLALGISGRIEYVMPYFSVNVGMGTNILHGGGDLKAFYQILALKIEITRNSFLHIGYNLKNFKVPNFLMLGIGAHIHNKTPYYSRH